MKHVIALLASAAAAQVSAGPNLDALIAAPGNHRLVLENEQVRVLQVEVAPGETEPVHEHRSPSVLHIQSPQPGVDIRYERRGDQLVEIGRRQIPGGKPPPALWSPPEAPHAVQNLGSEPFRLLRIELKTAQTSARPR